MTQKGQKEMESLQAVEDDSDACSLLFFVEAPEMICNVQKEAAMQQVSRVL